MNRDLRGRFSKKVGFIWLVVIIALAYFAVWFIPLQQKYYAAASTITVASSSPSQLEQLIETETDTYMQRADFQAEMRQTARERVVGAINTTTSAELYDYLKELKAEAQ